MDQPTFNVVKLLSRLRRPYQRSPQLNVPNTPMGLWEPSYRLLFIGFQGRFQRRLERLRVIRPPPSLRTYASGHDPNGTTERISGAPFMRKPLNPR